jgi:hypothetical protein
MPADNTIDINRNIVLSLDSLSWYRSELNLDIYAQPQYDAQELRGWLVSCTYQRSGWIQSRH